MADKQRQTMWKNLTLGYSDPHNPELCREIAKLYNGISEGQILVTNSTQESISLAFYALLKPGDHIISPVGYEPHYQLPEALGAKVDLWRPENVADGSWKFSADELESMVNENTKIIVLCFPHNPTGSLLSKEELQRIIEIADSKGITIVSDEIFRGVERDASKTLPASSELSRNAISCSGLSKIYGAAGLRIGWMTVQDETMRDRLLTWRSYSTISVGGANELLGTIAVQNTEKIVRENRKTIEKNLSELSLFFSRHSDKFKWSTPASGTIGLAEVIGETAERFSEKARSRAGIMVVPASVLDHGNKHIRIGYGRKKIPEVLSALEEII